MSVHLQRFFKEKGKKDKTKAEVSLLYFWSVCWCLYVSVCRCVRECVSCVYRRTCIDSVCVCIMCARRTLSECIWLCLRIFIWVYACGSNVCIPVYAHRTCAWVCAVKIGWEIALVHGQSDVASGCFLSCLIYCFISVVTDFSFLFYLLFCFWNQLSISKEFSSKTMQSSNCIAKIAIYLGTCNILPFQ